MRFRIQLLVVVTSTAILFVVVAVIVSNSTVDMDRGAARYRRTEGQRDRTTAATDRIRHTAKPTKVSDDTTDKPSSTANTSRFKPKVIDNTDPARFRPKAIRDSAALLWPQGAFEIPPSPDILSRVTRVDLSSSGCTDVSWLAGTRVTWLSVRGCKLSSGWGAVGSLSDLAGQFSSLTHGH